jgi:AMP-polyphosphate phosphotransferase
LLVEAEMGHRIDKQTFAKAIPSCCEALIEAQYELAQSRHFATVVLLSGVSGAGKSEAVNRLQEQLRRVPRSWPTAGSREMATRDCADA